MLFSSNEKNTTPSELSAPLIGLSLLIIRNNSFTNFLGNVFSLFFFFNVSSNRQNIDKVHSLFTLWLHFFFALSSKIRKHMSLLKGKNVVPIFIEIMVREWYMKVVIMRIKST